MNSNKERNMDWKPTPNICRCCLTDGCYKNISAAYYFSGEKEVYEEMLKETLHIQISDQNGANKLICEDCIGRLRDACAFKQTILQSEATLSEYDTLQHSEDIDMESGLKLSDVKVEPLPIETDCVSNGCPDDASLDDDEILANIKDELTKNDSSLKDGTKKPARLKRKSMTKKSRMKHENADSDQDKWKALAERRGTGPLLRENSLKLLANSTMSVFQWNKSWYRCFCCKEPFPDMIGLKQHTQTSHTLEHIKKKIILQQNRLVKVEVSDLRCKICQKPTENLQKLKQHLEEHDIKIEGEDLLVPFKIEANLKCQICLENFTVFRLLNMHMNKHFQKQVCHICGAAFSNLVFLNLHKTRSHRPFRCKHCDDVFSNKIDKKHHEISVHNVKYERKLRFPCPYCNERFFQENFKVLHLVEKHGLPKPEHKCLVCEKTFVTRSLCNNHMKNVHMKEKNHECDVCHNLFYTKSDVTRHRVTHTGEKRFCCTLCSTPFATKDSLRRHMKRTHVGLH
ncbi:zinc finger protein 728-like isoform X24 [Cydia pomonella]|uniref:zinc finger protein 728-like isoform X24 n=1 Tax=Cydia pomonella TaxID=82600 RepID=UPI002ADE0410|nr:zinc finger protein 728-like isoform X24 [Cydia pomonella]